MTRTATSYKKNTLVCKSALLGLSAQCLLLATTANAGDEPVNCKNVQVSETKIYAGHASCTAYHYYTKYDQNRNSQRHTYSETLSRNVDETTKRWVTLTGMATISTNTWFLNDFTYRTGISCSAEVPYSHSEPVMEQQCEYTPRAGVRVIRDEGTTETYVKAHGSDRDGHIVKAELWVDGVKQAGDSLSLYGNSGDTFQVTGRVTDNDGHTDQISKTITLVVSPPRMCGNEPC
ncbi:hypothetical protein [Pseudoalteromonas sp. MMG022]|uniref:hypothetical protein n=1 Tax=Pseudoalteromonas sp. MMG022 TaxID=2909978 RepID=UPI001F4064AF|nr:hypothetical protein [Pseudoalteromonas sp. MMG022]MCF6434909.1 hypothetical protein [Pseudoalteromonas sp. MMG022]